MLHLQKGNHAFLHVEALCPASKMRASLCEHYYHSFTLLISAAPLFLTTRITIAIRISVTGVAIIAAGPSVTYPIIPAMRNPTAETDAAVIAYGSCVLTWLIWLHAAPAEDMIVVSEIGEQ